MRFFYSILRQKTTTKGSAIVRSVEDLLQREEDIALIDRATIASPHGNDSHIKDLIEEILRHETRLIPARFAQEFDTATLGHALDHWISDVSEAGDDRDIAFALMALGPSGSLLLGNRLSHIFFSGFVFCF